ncbi:hypothetical protein F5Y17DRAFT_459400 [Xylariaceae sp. FL0594]|nr:hypothetical protein F5Y17DRAFT_459400 [Xylariaceae sp. FL0594]
MAHFQLDGYALVVGASGGIGREVVYAFAEAGVKGIILARQALYLGCLRRTHYTSVDVTDVTSVDEMVKFVVEKFNKKIHYLVDAFGVDVAEYVDFRETKPED